MGKILVLVRTQLDAATKISYAWAEIIKNTFQNNNWLVLELSGDDAVRSKVENLLEDHGDIVFAFYGHGSPNELFGQDRTSIVNIGNFHLLSRKTVYAVACHSAKELGLRSSRFSCSYLGYEDALRISLFDSHRGSLGECVNRGLLAMSNGEECTIDEAHKLILDEYNYWIAHFTRLGGVINRLVAITILSHNRDCLRLHS
jgi:hypothetical protein